MCCSYFLITKHHFNMLPYVLFLLFVNQTLFSHASLCVVSTLCWPNIIFTCFPMCCSYFMLTKHYFHMLPYVLFLLYVDQTLFSHASLCVVPTFCWPNIIFTCFPMCCSYFLLTKHYFHMLPYVLFLLFDNKTLFSHVLYVLFLISLSLL